MTQFSKKKKRKRKRQRNNAAIHGTRVKHVEISKVLAKSENKTVNQRDETRPETAETVQFEIIKTTNHARTGTIHSGL